MSGEKNPVDVHEHHFDQAWKSVFQQSFQIPLWNTFDRYCPMSHTVSQMRFMLITNTLTLYVIHLSLQTSQAQENVWEFWIKKIVPFFKRRDN